MKKITSHIILLAMLIALAAGCSKSNNDDAASLLSTIPADASSVVILNMQQTVKSLGGKTDGTTVDLPSDLKKHVAESSAIKDDHKKIFNDLCNGETGVSITSLAFFSAARSYVTGLLNDPDKFVDYMSKHIANPADSIGTANVVEENGARLIDNDIVVIGNQFWICTAGTPDIEQLKYYQNLNDRQSYASSETADLLLEKDKVVTYVADVKRSFDRMPESTYLRMATAMMFDDIAYVAGSADFKGKDLIASSRVLNSKMKPAELLLPTEKIDAAVVKSLNRDGDIFLAAGLSKKFTKKISDALSSALGSNASSIASPLEQIDGTIAICSDIDVNSLEARIETTGKDFASLSNMIQMIPGVAVTRDGDMLTVKYGNPVSTGKITAEEAASSLKNSWIGVVASDFPADNMKTVACLVPDNKSLKLDIEIEGGVDAIMTALLK
ncbi:MAG: hypothetical protein NC095_10530 [Muribaculum sp.]|nr:hypothetical protein [Muribaculum sp.]